MKNTELGFMFFEDYDNLKDITINAILKVVAKDLGIADQKIEITSLPQGMAGAVDRSTGRIEMSLQLYGDMYFDSSDEFIRKVMHELRHAWQRENNWDMTGYPERVSKSTFKQYWNHPTEVDARTYEKRDDLIAEIIAEIKAAV